MNNEDLLPQEKDIAVIPGSEFLNRRVLMVIGHRVMWTQPNSPVLETLESKTALKETHNSIGSRGVFIQGMIAGALQTSICDVGTWVSWCKDHGAIIKRGDEASAYLASQYHMKEVQGVLTK